VHKESNGCSEIAQGKVVEVGIEALFLSVLYIRMSGLVEP
jgi:hypothetical protein